MLQNLYINRMEKTFTICRCHLGRSAASTVLLFHWESIDNLFEHRQTEAYNINYGVRNFEIGFPNMCSWKSLSICGSAVRNIFHLNAKCRTMNKQALAFSTKFTSFAIVSQLQTYRWLINFGFYRILDEPLSVEFLEHCMQYLFRWRRRLDQVLK